jgi:hypothetical protein
MVQELRDQAKKRGDERKRATHDVTPNYGGRGSRREPLVQFLELSQRRSDEQCMNPFLFIFVRRLSRQLARSQQLPAQKCDTNVTSSRKCYIIVKCNHPKLGGAISLILLTIEH